MKKKNILNLIRYHVEKNEDGFRREAYDIAKYFDSIGDFELAQYVMGLISGANTFVPQSSMSDLSFFTKIDLTKEFLHLPPSIESDILAIIRSVDRPGGVNKFLFEGDPGTGKTEATKRIANALGAELYAVDFESVVDSKLGQTSKNIMAVFNELHNLPQPKRMVVLFDEIDVIALDRINSNDLREMGRVTSSVLKGLDNLSSSIVLIATTNLYGRFDKALTRRFDLVINFNRYSQEDLMEIAELILNDLLTKFEYAGRNIRLFRKIIKTMKELPHPGQLTNIIKSSLALSSSENEYAYLAKLYQLINQEEESLNPSSLQKKGFTVREMGLLTNTSKSQIARGLKG